LPNKRAAQRFIGIRQNNLSSKMKQKVIFPHATNAMAQIKLYYFAPFTPFA